MVSQRAKDATHRGYEFIAAHADRPRTGRDEVCGSRHQLGLEVGDDGAETTTEAVAGRRVADPTAQGVGDPGGLIRRAPDAADGDRPGAAGRGSGERDEGRMVADAPDQAERRARPRERRALSTARPPRVRMRVRNPCFFLRFRLLGWNVRFTMAP